MSNQEKRPSQRCKYVKMPVKVKIAFFKKVLNEKMSIKDSAAMFSINYSTAKTLMRQYKFNMLPFDITQDQQEPPTAPFLAKKALLRCSYKDIDSEHNSDQCEKEAEISMEYSSFQLKSGSQARKLSDESVLRPEPKVPFENQSIKIEIISSLFFA